jgi:hypothetical protein
MTAVDLAGWVGAATLLVAYAATAAGRLRSGGRADTANVLGSLGLVVVAGAHRAWPSVALNLMGISVALAASAHRTVRAHRSPSCIGNIRAPHRAAGENSEIAPGG